MATRLSGPLALKDKGGTSAVGELGAYIVVTLSSAQLLALNGTPITVISAPAANKAIVIDRVVAYKPSGTAYTVAGNKDIVLRYTDGSGTILIGVETTGFLDQTTAQTRYEMPQSAVGTGAVEVTPTAAAAIVAHMTTGEVTTGNSAVKLGIWYRTIDTVL